MPHQNPNIIRKPSYQVFVLIRLGVLEQQALALHFFGGDLDFELMFFFGFGGCLSG